MMRDDHAEGRVMMGICVVPQYTDWTSLSEIGADIERLGFDSLWTTDHLYPDNSSPDGPIFEGYLTLAGWACRTERITLGLMVGANTFRNPSLTAKMITTLDHMSRGRAILGLGAGWYQFEHEAYGLDFGSSAGARLDRLDEAVMIVRGMLDGREPSGRSLYPVRSVRNIPPPLQPHLPILIGGSGEKKTLATVARYADMWTVGGDLESVRHKNQVLWRWCQEVGRDSSRIERILAGGAVVVKKTEPEARRFVATIEAVNSGLVEAPRLVGSPASVAAHLAPYILMGFHNFCFYLLSPYDRQTLELLAHEVRPVLDEELHRARH